MTRRMSLVAVCCSSAALNSVFLVWASSKRRVFASVVAVCCSRASTSSPLAWASSSLAWESSLLSSWILRSAEARSSVGEAVMTTRAFHTTCPHGFGLPDDAGKPVRLWGMLRDMAARWNVLSRGVGRLPQPTMKIALKEHRRAAALGISTCWCSAHTRMCSDYCLVQTRLMGSARRIRLPCET